MVVQWGKEGWSIIEMCAEIGIVRQTFLDWQDTHPEFSEAATRAKTCCQAYWEREGRTGMKSDRFNASVWTKNMQCRFPDDWRDVQRQEQTGANGGAIQTETRVIKMVVVDPKTSE
jgi:hypothetical protein